jgi:WD40 repeat protein
MGCGRRRALGPEPSLAANAPPISTLTTLDAGETSKPADAADATADAREDAPQPAEIDALTSDVIDVADSSGAAESVARKDGSGSDAATLIVAPWKRPASTVTPFSCAPMPTTFIFPLPGTADPGAYNRCASFDPHGAADVAISPDGRIVALVTGDGIARVVDVESRQVVAVLAPLHSRIGLAAYSPRGDLLLTVARGEHEVTLWSTSSWTALSTISLPSTGYYDEFPGGAAIAPDGKTAVISPGYGVYLVDLSTRAIIASRPVKIGPVMDLAYAWNGRRIVVVEATMKAHCQHHPNGGDVDVLDQTLAPIATVSSWGGYGTGQYLIPSFAASPSDDLIVTTVPLDYDGTAVLAAFRVSDGTRLPSSPVPSVPRLIMPDGKRALFLEGGGARLSDLAPGGLTLAAMVGDGGLPGPIDVSTNGRVIAVGGSGSSLLGVWDTTGVIWTDVCSDEQPAAGWSGYPTGPLDGEVASPGGELILKADEQMPYNVTLWRATPTLTMVRTFAQRPDAAALMFPERAVAVTADGGRVFTDAAPNLPCYSGPTFEINAHDVSSGRLLDILPPGPTSLDALGTTLAYGPELWCAR